MNNKNIFTVALTALAIVSAGQIASARDEDHQNNDSSYREQDTRDWNHDRDHDRGDRLDNEINHLNRMLNHVDRKINRYGANWHIRREFQRVREEARDVNNHYRNSKGYENRRRLRAKVEHIHDELHQIERELNLRKSEWYQWH